MNQRILELKLKLIFLNSSCLLNIKQVTTCFKSLLAVIMLVSLVFFLNYLMFRIGFEFSSFQLTSHFSTDRIKNSASTLKHIFKAIKNCKIRNWILIRLSAGLYLQVPLQACTIHTGQNIQSYPQRMRLFDFED